MAWKKEQSLGDSKMLKEYEGINEIFFNYRDFVYPQYVEISFKLSESNTIKLEKLFNHLSLNLEHLKLIFEFSKGEFNGKFTQNGKQVLANILKKTIIYHHSSEYGHIDPNTKEQFKPQK